MNSISLIKIGLLIKRQWLERSRIYIVGATLLALSLAFLFALTHHWRDSFSGGVRNGIFLIVLFLGGGLFTSSLFNEFTNKSRGMWLLTIPASAAEKVLTAAFFSIIVYVAVYVALFSLIDQVYVLIVQSPSFRIEKVDFFKNGFYEFFFTYMNFTGIVMLGSIYFNRASFIKTMLVVICLFFLVTTGNNYILQWVTGLPVVVSNTPFETFQFRNNGENVYVRMPAQTQMYLSFIFRIIVPLFLWYIAYVRLKEKEL